MMGDMRDRLIQSLLQIYKKDNAPLVFYFTEDEAEFVADQLIESGVILPPFKVGTPIYFPYEIRSGETFIDEGVVQSIAVCEDGVWFRVIYEKLSSYWHKESNIGKEVFLSKEDAENMLKQQTERTAGDNGQ